MQNGSLRYVGCLAAAIVLAVAPARAQVDGTEAACAATSRPSPALEVGDAPAPAPAPLLAMGVLHCELGRNVDVREVAADLSALRIRWGKREYSMSAIPTASGAMRFENPATGLAMITVAGKTMLLDTRRGRQLANECKAAVPPAVAGAPASVAAGGPGVTPLPASAPSAATAPLAGPTALPPPPAAPPAPGPVPEPASEP